MENHHLIYQGKKYSLFLSLISFTAFLFLLSSCKVTQQSMYFKTLQQKDTTLKGFVGTDFESKIVKGDRLSIILSSLNPSEDAVFNAAAGSGSGASSAGGYTVEPDGTISLHRLGKISVEGLTRRELVKQIQDKLTPFLKEPIVQVNYLNHKVTILGEVGKPQVLSLPEDQISLIDALVLSGDLTASAKRTSITVIREEGNEKKVKHLNLEDNSIFSSPWYYVRPNDIILVSSDTEKSAKAEKKAKLQTNLALITSGITFLIIILDRVIK